MDVTTIENAGAEAVGSGGPTPTPPAPPAVVPQLSVRNVTKRFTTTRHDTLALDRISLDIQPGEFVCLVGPSGCGKSTLLNMLAGLDFPNDGEILLCGRRVTKPGPERGFVFQEPALYPWMNVRQNVEFGLKLKGVKRSEQRPVVDRYLEMVNLARFDRAYVHELSGGMKQRLQLARALAVEPAVLLMDEPFAALDAQTRDSLLVELQDIWERTGKTIVFVTHNVREAVILADRVIVLTPGPGRIKRIINVNLHRPRPVDSHDVVDLAALVRVEMEHQTFMTAPVGGADVR